MGRPKGSKNRPLKVVMWLNQFNGIIKYMMLNAEQRGVLQSIFHAYAQNGWLPSDTGQLAAACSLTVEEIERTLPGLRGYIEIDGDQLKCWYIDGEKKRMAEQSKKGKDGADARWDNDSGTSKSEKDVPEETEPQEGGVFGNAEVEEKSKRKEVETESKGKAVDKTKPFFPAELMTLPRARTMTPPSNRDIARFIDSVCRDLLWDETAEERTAWTNTIKLYGFDGGIAGRDAILRAREIGESIDNEKRYFSKCLKWDVKKIA